MTFDNNGRRQRIRDVLSNDPLYRRVKDAMLIIFAILGAAGYAGIDVFKIFSKTGMPITSEDRSSLRNRMTNVESSLSGMDRRLERVEDKVDRILTINLENRRGG